MGVYDTVMVPCPKCGGKYECQSKSGDCTLMTYELEEAPAEVLYDVNHHAPYYCPNCNIKFGVQFEIRPAKVKNVKSVVWKEDDEGTETES